jgi:hypothetical protein
VPVSKKTREEIHHLKKSMKVTSQAEVIEKAVAIVRAIDISRQGRELGQCGRSLPAAAVPVIPDATRRTSPSRPIPCLSSATGCQPLPTSRIAELIHIILFIWPAVCADCPDAA